MNWTQLNTYARAALKIIGSALVTLGVTDDHTVAGIGDNLEIIVGAVLAVWGTVGGILAARKKA